MIIKVSYFLCFIGTISSTCMLTVNKDNNDYNSIPQDIKNSVTCLNLKRNKIPLIDNTSFHLFKELEKVKLDYNPLDEVNAGVFDNNPLLKNFACFACRIASFPPDFGPATPTLQVLYIGFALKDISVLGQLKLQRFPKLVVVYLTGIPVSNLDNVNLPPTMYSLDIDLMQLSVFPNLSSARFPRLGYLRADRNQFQETPNPVLGVSKTMWSIDIIRAKMRSADGIASLPRLYGFRIHENELETVPDLLGLRKLRQLRIAVNSRMNCDYRMCWRRLWNRLRSPLVEEDDVICVEPRLLANKILSLVNPKFMRCDNGKLWIELYTEIVHHNMLLNKTCFCDRAMPKNDNVLHYIQRWSLRSMVLKPFWAQASWPFTCWGQNKMALKLQRTFLNVSYLTPCIVLTHWGRVTHICVSKLCHHWFR